MTKTTFLSKVDLSQYEVIKRTDNKYEVHETHSTLHMLVDENQGYGYKDPYSAHKGYGYKRYHFKQSLIETMSAWLTVNGYDSYFEPECVSEELF